MAVITKSTLTCPQCGFAEQVEMPVEACQYFYACRHCHALLKPKAGDCCVFCSFGTIKCPPKQIGESCC